jgi:hypothetical protein
MTASLVSAQYLELTNRYAYHVDRFEASRVAELFTEDGVLDLTEFGYHPLVGRSAIAGHLTESWTRIARSFHANSNQLVVSAAGDVAKGSSYVSCLTWLKAGDARLHVHSTYEDEIVLQGGRWLFRSRILHHVDIWRDILSPDEAALSVAKAIRG